MRPRHPSGKFQELGGQELEELIETDQPAKSPFAVGVDDLTASVDEYEEEPTVDDVVPSHQPQGAQMGTPAPTPTPGQGQELSTGPGLAHEQTAQISSDVLNGPHSIDLEMSEPRVENINVLETAAIRKDPRPLARHRAVTPDPQSEPQAAAESARPRRRTDSQEMVDEMLGEMLGSYRIISLLGEGGMGRVYMAEHVKLGRKVALKLLRPEYAVKKDAVRRFFQEARAVNKIGHDNIVDITDLQELNGGTFIIMEMLQGEDLSDLVRNADAPMPLHRAMQIATQVCDALIAAHKTGVVHRDLKPDNIFIVNTATKRDFVKLLDFGVAKLFNEENDGWQTAVGSVIGTPAYMSPEQATGIPVDHRSDIYSLGAIMYELFTGHPVFRAKSFGEFVVKHMNDEPVPPRDLANAPKIPAALEMVILRCLEKPPEKRYQSVEDLRDDLSRATATVETAIKLNPLAAAKATGQIKKKGKHRWVILPMGLAIAGMAVLAFLLASGVFEGSGSERPEVLPSTTTKVNEPAKEDTDEEPEDTEDTEDTEEPAKAPEKTDPTPIKAPPVPPEKVAAKVRPSVILRLHTQPPGAEVFRKDRPGKSLGKTPLNLVLGSPDEQFDVIFRLKGYADHTESVSGQNTLVSVPLERRAKTPRPEPVVRLKTAPPDRKKVKRPKKKAGKPPAKKKKTGKPAAAKKPAKKARPTKVKKKIKGNEQLDPFAQ